MRAAFWISALFIVYVYVGYPALLAVWARVSPRPLSRANRRTPGVTIVIAARNEAARLPARIANLLSLDYPSDRCQIVVASDGSTDDTAAAVAPFSGRVELLMLPPGGKAAALNAGVARARHDLLVFTDARQSFARDALRELVAPFAEPAIGGVTGQLILGCEADAGRRHGSDRRHGVRDALPGRDQRSDAIDRRSHVTSSVADGVGLYWRYEKALRSLESRVGSTLGATGAIFALRRALWRPLPADTILDDVLAPMRAVLAGFRVVFNERAMAFDHTPPDASVEERRKIRTLAGNVQILWLEPRLLVPVLNPVWVQYVSHKVGRLLVPYALLAVMTTSMVLAEQHFVYALALAAQCALYLLAAYGALLERKTASARVRLAPQAQAAWRKGAVNA